MLQRIARTDVNKHSEGPVTLMELYVDNFIAISNDIRHSHLENCHRRCCMGYTRSFPHTKLRSIMGLTLSQREKRLTVTAYGTSTRRSWSGTWTAYNTLSNYHQRNAGYTRSFPPHKVTVHNGFDLVAERKTVDGYSIWDFYKEILVWDLDGIQYTIQLPPKKCRIHAIFSPTQSYGP